MSTAVFNRQTSNVYFAEEDDEDSNEEEEGEGDNNADNMRNGILLNPTSGSTSEDDPEESETSKLYQNKKKSSLAPKKKQSRERHLTITDPDNSEELVQLRKHSNVSRKNTGVRRSKRNRHTLFNPETISGTNGNSPINYDIEAVKLEHARKVWPNGTTPPTTSVVHPHPRHPHHRQQQHRRPSISSEESLSDCEELGLLHTGLVDAEVNGERLRTESRTDSTSKSLWDEQEINVSLRAFVVSHLPDTKNESLMLSIEKDDRKSFIELTKHMLSSQVNIILLLAIWKGASNIVEYLLNQDNISPNICDGAGRSCLHLAAINGKLSIMESLINHGAKIDAFDRHHLATPLFCAAVSDNSDGIGFLIEKGANINAGLHEFGVSALHCAVRVNHTEHVKLLLEMGAVPNNVQLFSETPLHTAASMGFEECVKLLIDHGACLEVLMGSMKMTALHLAAQDGNTESVQYLVQGGANIDAKNARGQSALHLAALAQSPETVEVLLKNGKRKISDHELCFYKYYSSTVCKN